MSYIYCGSLSYINIKYSKLTEYSNNSNKKTHIITEKNSSDD